MSDDPQIDFYAESHRVRQVFVFFDETEAFFSAVSSARAFIFTMTPDRKRHGYRFSVQGLSDWPDDAIEKTP